MERRCTVEFCQMRVKVDSIDSKEEFCEQHRQQTSSNLCGLDKIQNNPLNEHQETENTIDVAKMRQMESFLVCYEKISDLSIRLYLDFTEISGEINKLSDVLNQILCDGYGNGEQMQKWKKPLKTLLREIEKKNIYFTQPKKEIKNALEILFNDMTQSSKRIYFCKYEIRLNKLNIHYIDIENETQGLIGIGPNLTRKVLSCRISLDQIFFCSHSKTSKSFIIKLNESSDGSVSVKKIKPSNEKHTGGGFTLFDSKIYFFGGESTKCEYFDLSTKTWQKIEDLPIGFKNCSCCIYNKKIYIVGSESRKVLIYDPEMNKFEKLKIDGLDVVSNKICIVVDGNFLVIQDKIVRKLKKGGKRKQRFKKIGSIVRKNDEKPISTDALVIGKCAYFVDSSGNLITMDFTQFLKEKNSIAAH